MGIFSFVEIPFLKRFQDIFVTDAIETPASSGFSILFSDKLDELGQRSWKMSRPIEPFESFYGLGDKPVTLDLRGRKLVNWGTDTYAYPYGADPLYKNIPFFLFP